MSLAERTWLEPQVRHHLDGVVDVITREFAGTFGRETVERFIDDTLDRWSEARTTTYVPVLVHRFVRERLRAHGQAEGLLPRYRPEVLLVCTGNAGRSQMAAALLARHAGDAVGVRSAGAAPAAEVDARVAAVLSELGINLVGAYPKPLTAEVVKAADVIVTMGCGDACPIFPGKRYLDWDVGDPARRDLETVRRIRDDVDLLVRGLLDDLGIEPRT